MCLHSYKHTPYEYTSRACLLLLREYFMCTYSACICIWRAAHRVAAAPRPSARRAAQARVEKQSEEANKAHSIPSVDGCVCARVCSAGGVAVAEL